MSQTARGMGLLAEQKGLTSNFAWAPGSVIILSQNYCDDLQKVHSHNALQSLQDLERGGPPQEPQERSLKSTQISKSGYSHYSQHLQPPVFQGREIAPPSPHRGCSCKSLATNRRACPRWSSPHAGQWSSPRQSPRTLDGVAKASRKNW